jgi:glycosyltransferase involved in cell wall biosynthesis
VGVLSPDQLENRNRNIRDADTGADGRDVVAEKSKTAMKVIFFIDSLRAGGKERQLAELVKGLTSRNLCTCSIVSMSYDNHYFVDSDIEIHYLVRRYRKDINLFFRFYSLVKEMKPDIIHTWDSMTSVYAIPSARLLNVKLINGMIRDALPDGGIYDKRRFWSRLSFPFSDVLVANSKAGLRSYCAPPDKSHCIYNGFDFQRLEVNNATDCCSNPGINTGYVVGMVASFSENKDYRSFFKAAELVLEQRQDVTFVAVGEGTSDRACEQLIPEPVRNHFRLMGKQRNVESIVSRFDIGVLSTSDRHGEGISNSITEYMASGKPVIATDAGGTCELVIDGITGFLVSRGDYRSMADYLMTLLNDRDLAEKMGNAGKQRIANEFSLERMIDGYAELYSKLLDGRNV